PSVHFLTLRVVYSRLRWWIFYIIDPARASGVDLSNKNSFKGRVRSYHATTVGYTMDCMHIRIIFIGDRNCPSPEHLFYQGSSKEPEEERRQKG
ncbi:unnamed protein product, partial [Allacma fusca]